MTNNKSATNILFYFLKKLLILAGKIALMVFAVGLELCAKIFIHMSQFIKSKLT